MDAVDRSDYNPVYIYKIMCVIILILERKVCRNESTARGNNTLCYTPAVAIENMCKEGCQRRHPSLCANPVALPTNCWYH